DVLNRATGTATVIWSLADRMGPVDLVQHDTNTGATTLVNHIQYDIFGQLLSETHPTPPPWFGYTGREWDSAAGLSYYRARWYDPRAGRFISEGPLSFAAGDVNLNRYVGNGATIWVDPSGMIMHFPTEPRPTELSPEVGNLVGGSLKLAGGALLAGVAVVGEISSTGLSSVAVIGGAATTADGLDRVVAGFQELLAGTHRETAFESTASQLSGDHSLAALTQLWKAWEEYALHVGSATAGRQFRVDHLLGRMVHQRESPMFRETILYPTQSCPNHIADPSGRGQLPPNVPQSKASHAWSVEM
ncbi:MAG: RHS repeat-associated core domain-containing protein, partial [Planctomycetaceae bacterium]